MNVATMVHTDQNKLHVGEFVVKLYSNVINFNMCYVENIIIIIVKKYHYHLLIAIISS